MVYVLIIVYAIPSVYKNKKLRAFLMLSSILLQVGVSKYSFLFTSQVPSVLLYRNFLVPVIGYFLLGISIRECSKRNVDKKIAVCGFVVAVILLFIEKTILWRLGAERSSGTYLMSVFVSFFTFILILNREPTTKVEKLITTFGREYSLIFYIIHPQFVKFETRLFNMSNLQQMIGIAFVYTASLISSIIVTDALNRYKLKSRS